MKKAPGLYLRGNVWWLTWRSGGRKRYVSLQTTDYAEAVALAVQVRQADVGGPVGSIEECGQRFLAHKTASGLYARHTGDWAASALRQFAEFCGNCAVARVTGRHLETWAQHLRDARGLSASSVASYMRVIRSFFGWLHARGELAVNPARGVVMPKVAQPARVEFCTRALRDRLIADAPESLRLILLLGFRAGLRKNEIIEARPGWITPDAIHIEPTPTFRPKDRERRAIPLHPDLIAHFATFPPAGEYLIAPEVTRGRALYRYDFRAPFEAYMREKGCEWVTAHTMRRTFASLLVSAGVSIYKVARWLGDGVAVAERHYGHLVVADADIERS